MLYITKTEADRTVAYVNGFQMTYGEYLDNTNQKFEIIGA